jgi:hypothetical protein
MADCPTPTDTNGRHCDGLCRTRPAGACLRSTPFAASALYRLVFEARVPGSGALNAGARPRPKHRRRCSDLYRLEDATPNDIIARLERYSGVGLREAFAIPDLDREIKWHAKLEAALVKAIDVTCHALVPTGTCDRAEDFAHTAILYISALPLFGHNRHLPVGVGVSARATVRSPLSCGERAVSNSSDTYFRPK